MVTVTQLVDRAGLDLTAVHLPDPDAGVRWVATSELADPTPYLEGGEVLLTTGLGTADWDGEWQPYVERLAAAGVSALGLAAGLTHATAPPALVRACEQSRVNLFTVPRPTRFVAVSREAAALLEAERESATRRAFDAQHALTQSALDPEGVTALVERLAGLVDGAAALVGRDGAVLEGPHGPRSAALDLASVREEVARLLPRGLRAAASAAGPAGTTIVRPLGVHARPEAWLSVLVPGRPAEAERVALSTAVTLLGLALERRREQRRTGRRLRARAVELVLADEPRTARIVLGAATRAGDADPSLPRRVRVLRAVGSDDDRHDALAAVEQERLLAGVVGDELVVVAGAVRAAAVADLLAHRGLRVGVGRGMPTERASASHDTAGHALATTTAAAPVRTWDDLAGAGVVGLLGREAATAFAGSFLAPLGEDPVLLETLGAFLHEHGSRGETAARLAVHRNTVRNRVEQIEARLGRSLDDPQVRVDAWVALQVTGAAGALSPRAGSPATS